MSLSTHVLDTARGEPAVGVPVHLQRLTGERWLPVADGATDRDGRLRDWVPTSDWSAGRYRTGLRDGRGVLSRGRGRFRRSSNRIATTTCRCC